jgi:hypothetical protein
VREGMGIPPPFALISHITIQSTVGSHNGIIPTCAIIYSSQSMIHNIGTAASG